MRESFVVHSHSSRRACLKEDVGESFSDAVDPLKISARGALKSLAGAERVNVGTDGAVLIVIKLDVLGAKVLDHISDGLGEISDYLGVTEVGKAAVVYHQRLAVTAEEAGVVSVVVNDLGLPADALGLDPAMLICFGSAEVWLEQAVVLVVQD